MIRVQAEPFDLAEAFTLQAGRTDVGGLACFIGSVRDLTAGANVTALELQHYPGFTEQTIQRIHDEAAARFDILDQLIVHRYGKMFPGDPIVLVSTISTHREAAFDGARFVMDALKTGAPFWKKEVGPDGERWIEPRSEDYAASARWVDVMAAEGQDS
ncbi:MAG: molybdenum cofactor biosynthesis protein MoaE [Caulobacterales bacterium]